MNIKTFIIVLLSSFGLILGIYWFIITGSYFLLILASSLGIFFGFILGKEAKFAKETKKLYNNTQSKIKNR
ncbi:MAG: hypothetical protein ACFE9T_04515 [Promethearchaeota archaeon]